MKARRKPIYSILAAILFRLSFVALAFLSLGIVLGVVLYAHLGSSLPDSTFLKNYQAPEITRIYDNQYSCIYEYSGIKRLNVPFTYIPEKLVAAFLVAEDKNFYYHMGLDPFRITKAIMQNVWYRNHSQNFIGASTITQQVAKNFIVGNEKTFLRKLKEALVTLSIENSLSKDRILELYLNQIYLGHGTYGIQMAALKYFNKSVEKLSLAQMCLLAALPKAPQYFSDLKNIQRLKMRRNSIIAALKEQGYITPTEAAMAIHEPIRFTNTHKKNDDYGYYIAPLKDQLEAKLSKNFLSQGFEVFSCLDQRLQDAAQKALQNGLIAYDIKRGEYHQPITSLGNAYTIDQLNSIFVQGCPLHFQKAIVFKKEAHFFVTTANGQSYPLNLASWHLKTPLKTGDVVLINIKNKVAYLRQIPTISGAIVVMEAKTGNVLALVGGWDYKRNPFNCATQALRQPGSSFKPFAYLAALEHGTHPEDIIEDKPITLFLNNGREKYSPKNVTGKIYGLVTVKTSLAHSYNLAAVQLALDTGLDHVADVAELFNVYDKVKNSPSIVLGAQETTLLKLTAAYAMIFNGGYYLEPHFYRFYTKRMQSNYSYGVSRCYLETNTTASTIPIAIEQSQQRIASEKAIFGLLEMLRAVITQGSGKGLLLLEKKYGITIRGKTGTSNNNRDTWIVVSVNIPETRYQGDNPLIVGVFVGYLKPASLGLKSTGATVALPIFSNFIENYISGTL